MFYFSDKISDVATEKDRLDTNTLRAVERLQLEKT